MSDKCELQYDMENAMCNSGWWEVGNEAIDDVAEIAMSVTRQYTNKVHEILLSGYDAKVKVDMIAELHERLMNNK